jgi:glycolate oxidase FAD binding subunit
MSSDVTFAPITVDGADVDRVEEPATVEELRELLHDVGADGASALIAGGRTRTAFGNLGGPFDLAISTRRLNRVIHYEPDDMTLAVEPGCTIADIARLLDDQGQMIALDVAHPMRATIGGSYATGMSGPRRLGGGSLKDWVIGVEVAGIGGAVAKAGGMVVKNVTGFDMMHLHYGALGAFGVVARLNLKVFPRSGASRSVILGFRDSADAHAASVALLRSQLQPSSLLVSNDDGWQLAVRCDAPESAIARVAERVVETASSATKPDGHDVLDDGTAALVPFLRITDLSASRIVARLPVPASRQAAALRQIEAFDPVDVCADVGSGLVFLALSDGRGVPESVSRRWDQTTFLALPAPAKHGMDVFGPTPAAAADVIRRLKSSFDPARQLNRGRFALGL